MTLEENCDHMLGLNHQCRDLGEDHICCSYVEINKSDEIDRDCLEVQFIFCPWCGDKLNDA